MLLMRVKKNTFLSQICRRSETRDIRSKVKHMPEDIYVKLTFLIGCDEKKMLCAENIRETEEAFFSDKFNTPLDILLNGLEIKLTKSVVKGSSGRTHHHR